MSYIAIIEPRSIEKDMGDIHGCFVALNIGMIVPKTGQDLALVGDWETQSINLGN